jgi:hypothetical protein
MIAELLEHADGDERVGAAFGDGGTYLGRGEELAVEGDLEGRETAEDDVLVLDRDCATGQWCSSTSQPSRRTVLGEEIVGPTNDKFLYERRELAELLLAGLALEFGRIGIAALDDGELIVLAELLSAAEILWQGEVEKREVLGQIVLWAIRCPLTL